MANNIRVGAKRSLPANSDESPDSYHTAPIVKRKRRRTSEELNQRARQESRPAVPWTRKHATEVFIPREEVRATQVSFHAIESDGLADKPSKVSVNGYKNLLPKRHSNPRTAQTQNQPALPQSHPTKANSSYTPRRYTQHDDIMLDAESDSDTKRLERRAKRQRRRHRRHIRHLQDSKDMTEQMRRIGITAEWRVRPWLDGVEEGEIERGRYSGGEEDVSEMALDEVVGSDEDLVGCGSSSDGESSVDEEDERRTAVYVSEAEGNEESSGSSEDSDWQSEGEREYYLKL